MKITASMLREIADMPPEAVAATLRMLANQADADEARRAKDAERKRKSRGSHAEVTVTSADSPRKSTDPSPKERSPTPPKEITPTAPSEAKASSGATRTPADELAAVLDREHAEAVVAHRKAMRKPLTPHAARLLAGKFAKDPDPNAGADAMIAGGWQGYEPEWRHRSTGPPRGRSQNGYAAVALETMQEILDEQSRQGHHNGHAAPAGTDAGTVSPDRGDDQRSDDGRRPDGSPARQEPFAGGSARHGGPIIDLEVVPRPTRPQGH